MKPNQQTEYINKLKYLLDVRRKFGFDQHELLNFILKEFGYEIHITPKRKLIRLKRIWHKSI